MISQYLTVFVLGGLVTEFVRECIYWHRQCKPQEYPKQVNTLNAMPTSRHQAMSVDELLEASIEPNAELTRIEKAVCRKVGAQADSNEADVVMHAVRDGYDWDSVRELAERQLWAPGKFSPTNRIYGRI